MESKNINIIELAMKHKQIAIVITTLLVLFGVFALTVMPRNEFPEFTIRQGLVIGVYPGATSEQVEDQLATKVENFLYGFKEVNREKTYSISKEGILIVFVEVNTNVKDPDGFWDKIKFGLNNLKAELPPQVLALIANNDFGNTSAILLTVQSDTKNYKELEKELKTIETELRKIKTVSKVKHYGLQSEEIAIHIDNDKLAYYAIKPLNILTALQLEGSVYYGGELDNNNLITPIHIPANFKTEEDIKQQIIYADPLGNTVRVKDVAKVVRRYKAPSSYIKNNGASSLLISLEMQTGNNIVDFGKQVNESLKIINTKTPDDIKISTIVDMPKAVDHSILHFLKEFGIAIIAVIFVIMLFLPFRVAAVSGITIPISIFITLGILYFVNVFQALTVFPGHTNHFNTSLWTYQNKELPFVPVNDEAVPFLMKRDLRSAFEAMLKDSIAEKQALIRVENIKASILFMSATEDEFAPTKSMCEKMMARLEEFDFKYQFEHKTIEGGHAEPLQHFDLVFDFLERNFPLE